jgi:hypothetical protein
MHTNRCYGIVMRAMTKQTLLRLLGGAFLTVLLAAIPLAEPRAAVPARSHTAVYLTQASPESCLESDDEPVDPLSPVLRAIMTCHEELGLSDPQMDRLDELASEFFREARKRQRAVLAAQLALTDIMRPDPRDPARPADVAAAGARIREIARLQVEQDMALVRVIEATKAVLTPSQRARLARLMHGIETTRSAVPPRAV